MATQSDLAEYLDLSQSAVSKLKNVGVLPAPKGRSGYDRDACRLAYIRHLRSNAAGRDSARTGSLEAERARLASAQAEQVERRNARERGDVVSLADFRDAGLSIITMVVGRLQKVGATVAAGDHKLRVRIERAVDDALTELSMARVEQLAGTSGLGESAEEDE